MKILLCSVPFSPSVGGIETVSALLAERFCGAGHELVLVTQTPADRDSEAMYPVQRRPAATRLMSLVSWCDLVFHNNISLRLGWPLLLVNRPWVVAHHTWIARAGAAGCAGHLKRAVLRRAHNIAVSSAVAKSLPMPSQVIPNPYADDVFVTQANECRSRELIFVGRLVSDKGVQLLLQALALLRTRGLTPRLCVVGDGPEAASLLDQTRGLGIGEQVEFAGVRRGKELVDLLNQHLVAVVPSVWEEPFGLVALEAMACGCVPLVAQSGGLPDAIGPGGAIFKKGDSADLARAIGTLLADRDALTRLRAAAPAHLQRHTRSRVAEQYLQVVDHAYRTHRQHVPAASA